MEVLECSNKITETDVYMAIELGKMKESYDRIGKIIDSGTYKYLFLKRSILNNIVDDETDVNESETSLKATDTLEKLSFTDEEKFLNISLAGMMNIFNEEYAPQLFNLCFEIGRLEFKLNSYMGVLNTSIDNSLGGVLSGFIENFINASLDDDLINLKECLISVGMPTDVIEILDISDRDQINSFLNKLKELIINTCNTQVLSAV